MSCSFSEVPYADHALKRGPTRTECCIGLSAVPQRRRGSTGGPYDGWSNNALVVRDRIKALETLCFKGHIPLTIDPVQISKRPHLPYLHKLLNMPLPDFTRVVKEQPGKLFVLQARQRWATVSTFWRTGVFEPTKHNGLRWWSPSKTGSIKDISATCVQDNVRVAVWSRKLGSIGKLDAAKGEVGREQLESTGGTSSSIHPGIDTGGDGSDGGGGGGGGGGGDSGGGGGSGVGVGECCMDEGGDDPRKGVFWSAVRGAIEKGVVQAEGDLEYLRAMGRNDAAEKHGKLLEALKDVLAYDAEGTGRRGACRGGAGGGRPPG